MNTIKLNKPVIAHGEEITELTLRDPSIKEFTKIGSPMLIVLTDDGKTAIEIRQKVIANYIVELGAVPMSTVESLSFSDFAKCSNAVMSFFGQEDGETQA